MKTIAFFLVISGFLADAQANSILLYGVLQAERQYTELGYSDEVDEVKYEHDFESSPYGLGAEYRFADDEEFFLGAGALYQSAVKIKQNTTFYNGDQDPSAFTSRNDLQHMSFAHLYFSVYSRSTDKLKFFLGGQLTIPEWRSHGRFDKYRIRPGYGYRAGLEADLYKGLRAQIYYRHVILKTEDQGGYEGELNIGSLMLALGWEI